MGGDDLGDDEYLFDNGFIDTTDGRGTAISSDDENGSISDDDFNSSLATSSNKRKGAADAKSSSAADEDGEEDQSSSKKRKRKKNAVPTSSKNILIHAGRGIAMDSAEAQSMFLGTLYTHSIKLSEGKAAGGENNDEDDDKVKEDGGDSSETFSFQPHVYSPPSETDEVKKFRHNNLAAFLKSGPLPSNKRLKNWKHPNCPMVLVVTLSARRSVELMKQLSTLKLPIAKLFAKHMSVEDQVGLLKGLGTKSGGGGEGGGAKKGTGKCYSLAVGTPGRLLKLLRHERDEPGSQGLGALRLNHTEVVIIDCHEDSKGWNVCTLKDTSKDFMEFMKEGMIPQLEKRKGKLKLAMF